MKRLLPLSLLAAALFVPRAAAAQSVGVTLFAGTYRSGERIILDRDVFDLNETPFGARRATSVDLSPGCRATLYELSGYRGRSVELTARENDLGGTPLGRGSVSSVKVDCRGASWGTEGPRRVTLFRDTNFRGPSQEFDRDVPDLEATRLGARRASSISVPPGCRAVLHSEPFYRGRATTFDGDHRDLGRTGVGNDAASSLRVDCGDRPRRPGAPLRTPPGVTLFADRGFRGVSETFRGDVPDLAGSLVGPRTASSVQVPPECRVVLYGEPGYRGPSATLDADHEDLRRTPVGNDTVQSLRVVCDRPRR